MTRLVYVSYTYQPKPNGKLWVYDRGGKEKSGKLSRVTSRVFQSLLLLAPIGSIEKISILATPAAFL
jgi:hypothetical protein